MKIQPEMSKIFAESVRIVGALLRLAGNGEQFFSGIRQTTACPADLHDFLKLDQLEIIEPLGIIRSKQSGKVPLCFDRTWLPGTRDLFADSFEVDAPAG